MSNNIVDSLAEVVSERPELRKWFVATPSLIAHRQKATRKRKNEAIIKRAPALRASKPTTRTGTSKSALPSDTESVEVLGGSGREEVEEVEDDIYTDDGKGDQEVEADNPSDIDDNQSDEPPPSKKQRRPEPLESLTAYIDIISPPRTQRTKETSEARGPFFFTTKTPHREFLQSIANCAVDPNFAPLISSINQSRLQWKLNTPANDKKKPLSSESGYKALIVKLVSQIEKGRDTTITIFMPPMLKTRQDKAMDYTGFKGDSEDEELANGPMGSTIREQKAVIGTSNSMFIEQLRQKYRIGGDPRFPNKRVYTSGDGRSWELNDLRVQVWAHHLAALPPTATLDSPPASAHFMESQRLRVASGALAASSAPAPEPTAMPNPQQYAMPYGYPPPSHFYPPPYPYYQQPPFFQHGLHDPYLHHGVRPRTPGTYQRIPDGAASAPTSPLKIALPRPVSLSEFCEHYEIDADDQGRLAKLKFHPGDCRIDKLGREDWQGYAGFSKLAWDDVITKHKVFLRDVKAGSWA